MVKKYRISGIRRRKTAAESTSRYFQTIDLIITHLKREADKKKILELIRDDPSLKSMLNATAAVRLYHYMGMHVDYEIGPDKFTDDSTRDLELIEKRILKEEIETLLKDSFKLEIGLMLKIYEIENLFLSLLIEERNPKFQESIKSIRIREIEQRVEQVLLDIIRNYPSFYFYDFIGDLIGYDEDLRLDILEESSTLKEVSIEIEKRLEREEKEDKFIELSTLNRLIKKIHKNFEIKSYKELQTQTMPLRMIKRKILNFELEKFPISVPGLSMYAEGNIIKQKIIQSIDNALVNEKNYEEFEDRILSELKHEIINQLKNNPNDFLYLLQSLSESSFDDVIFLMNKVGINDVLHLIQTDEEIAEKIKTNLIRYNIKQNDLILLNDPSSNLIYRAKKVLCKLKAVNSQDFDLIHILYREDDSYQDLWIKMESELDFNINDLREFVRKKQIIDKVFFFELNLKNYSQIITLINFDEILNKLVLDIYYYIISKILRQLSRIIESYGKVSNDKSLIISVLKSSVIEQELEDWVLVKLEELSIQRLIERQKELVVVFNAINQVFLVNGFILSRLTDKSLKTSILELRNSISHVYEEVAPLKLKPDLVSPISYCLAYDLVKRIETYAKEEKQKVEEKSKLKKEQEEKQKKAIREKQEISTLNWIERKITSSLMGVNRPGMNPQQFYWEDKDTKTASEHLKIHSELDGEPSNRFTEFYQFSVDKIRSFVPEMKLPDINTLQQEVIEIINSTLYERLKHIPNEGEVKNMVEGERFTISKGIAKRIGKLLDKALYFKFKNKRRRS